jgi:trk system potassium uptake protein TrkH
MEIPILNWKFISKIGGFTLVLESLFMFISSAVSAFFDESIFAFVLSGCITLLIGLIIVFTSGIKTKIIFVGKRESFTSVSLAWLLFAVFGALPFYVSGEISSFPDALFESTSGITTTGASVLTDIEALPKGLLFWRCLLQWLGGMGIIAFSLALIPLLGGEAAQLFDAEATGLMHDKFRPRVTQMAKRLWIIYLSLTVVLVALLYLRMDNTFDAICHAFTTISTGGFSTKQNSIAYWDSGYIEFIIILFMIIGSINFSLLYFLFQGKFRKFFKDEELRWFLSIVFVGIVLITFSLSIDKLTGNILESFRLSCFQVVSIITSTGFSTGDFFEWGPFYWIIFLLFMVVCGCAGSTSGGLKTVRAVVLIKSTLSEFGKLIHPRAIIPIRLNGHALSFGIVQRLLAFAFLYIFIVFFSWVVLTLSGMSFIEALGASISAISNIGPGFGAIGPSGSYAGIPVFAKWYMSFLMIVGRLEIFTVLILFTPTFWKK